MSLTTNQKTDTVNIVLQPSQPSETISVVKSNAVSHPNSVMTVESSGTASTATIEMVGSAKARLYKKLEEVCSKYDLSLEDLKAANVLEKLCGCKPQDIVNLTEEEIEIAVQAFEKACLVHLNIVAKSFNKLVSWIKQDKDSGNIIDKIVLTALAEKDKKTFGVNALEKFWHKLTTKSDLRSELNLKEGEEVTSEVLKNYFNEKCTSLNKLKEKIQNNIEVSQTEIEKAKAEALEEFGKLVIRYESLEERCAITALIEELFSDQRLKATKGIISAKGNDDNAKGEISVSAETRSVEIIGKNDPLGNHLNEKETASFSDTLYSNMNEQQALRANQNAQERRESILNTPDEELTEEQRNYKANMHSEVAGTVQGLLKNGNSTLAKTVINDAINSGVSLDNIAQSIKETYGENSQIYQSFKALKQQLETERIQSVDVQNVSKPSKTSKPSTEVSTSGSEPTRIQNAINESSSNNNNGLGFIVNAINKLLNIDTVVGNRNLMNSAKEDLVNDITVERSERDENVSNSCVSNNFNGYYSPENGRDLKAYIESGQSKIIAIRDAFNMFNKLEPVDQAYAIAYYSTLDQEDQTSMLKQVNDLAFEQLLKYASSKTIAEMNDNDVHSSIAEGLLEKAQERNEKLKG